MKKLIFYSIFFLGFLQIQSAPDQKLLNKLEYLINSSTSLTLQEKYDLALKLDENHETLQLVAKLIKDLQKNNSDDLLITKLLMNDLEQQNKINKDLYIKINSDKEFFSLIKYMSTLVFAMIGVDIFLQNICN